MLLTNINDYVAGKQNLTKIEQRLFDARQNGIISEKKAAQIALVQIQVNFPELLSNNCNHDWQTAEITYDNFLALELLLF